MPDAGVDAPRPARPATCCCRAARSARPGSPARSATASSPPVQTSRPQPLLGDPARHRGAEERLAGVVARRRRRTRSANSRHGRGSRPRRGRTAGCRARAASSRTSTAAQVQRAVDPLRRPRPDVRVQRAEVLGGARSVGWRCRAAGRRGLRPVPEWARDRSCGRAHIRSGRVTPSTARPLRSTVAVAAHNQSRAGVSVGRLLVAARQHPARVVEPVVGAGQLLEVPGDPVRLAQLGRGGDDPRELAERPRAGRPRARGRAARRRRRRGPRPELGGVAQQAGRPARARTARRRPGCRWCCRLHRSRSRSIGGSIEERASAYRAASAPIASTRSTSLTTVPARLLIRTGSPSWTRLTSWPIRISRCASGSSP